MANLPRLRSPLFTCLLALAEPLTAAELWVAPNGSDQNPGTEAAPFATVQAAQRQGRELRRLADPSIANGVRIVMRGGNYALTVPLLVRPEDSGTATSPTVIAAAPGERPIISGGVAITAWRKFSGKISGLPAAAEGHVWIAETPRFNGRTFEFRQLWVGDHKAIRARAPNAESMARLLKWDRQQEEATVPAALVSSLRDPAGVELVVQQQWEIAVLRVRSIRIDGDEAHLNFYQPESRLEFEHPWPQPILPPEGGGAFFLANAIEFLDQPGEWFQDLTSGRVYYWPRDDEDLSRDAVLAPALETLVEIAGTADRPVAHVAFNGIGFRHTTWLRPSTHGHVPLQAGMFFVDAYKLTPKGTPDWRSLDNQAWIGRPPAAVSITGAQHLQFTSCRFEQLAFDGLDCVSTTSDAAITGNVFRDLGGNGILVGAFSAKGIEAHLPYAPADEREICSRIKITNNVVTDCANEDWGCVGIGVGFAREIAIEHNEIFNVSYTAVSLGWGWTRTLNAARNNRVHANHLHHFATRMCDTAGVYTLSAQPGTVVSENSIHSVKMSPYVDRPDHWFYLYTDEGSSFITVRDNWCEAEKFFQNANGPGNKWENNGPAVAAAIKDAAGLEPPYKSLLAP